MTVTTMTADTQVVRTHNNAGRLENFEARFQDMVVGGLNHTTLWKSTWAGLEGQPNFKHFYGSVNTVISGPNPPNFPDKKCYRKNPQKPFLIPAV